MANEVNNYEQFVVVAETEWKFDYGDHEKSQPKISCGCQKAKCSSCNRQVHFTANPRITKQSLKMGTIEWNMAFNDKYKLLDFTCQNLTTDGSVNEMHAELVRYSRSQPNESYGKENTIRHIFTRSTNSLSHGLSSRYNLFTIRVLKQRSMFPDFTSESTAVVGRWASDGKLRVEDQIFYVNKQLLTMHSEYFDRMFNSQYKEANQEEVELKHENANAAVFHDFLLVMFVPKALPNRNKLFICAAKCRWKRAMHWPGSLEMEAGSRSGDLLRPIEAIWPNTD